MQRYKALPLGQMLRRPGDVFRLQHLLSGYAPILL
jgi:hypothetical protein